MPSPVAGGGATTPMPAGPTAACPDRSPSREVVA